MASIAWKSSGLTWDEACRQAAGRRRYHEHRQALARQRRREVTRLLLTWGEGWGVQRRMARQLEVSPATISRDVATIKRMWGL